VWEGSRPCGRDRDRVGGIATAWRDHDRVGSIATARERMEFSTIVHGLWSPATCTTHIKTGEKYIEWLEKIVSVQISG